MSLDQMVADAVYDTLVAEDAIYVDASGAETTVRVIPERDAATLLTAADLGVRGVQLGYYVRKSALRDRPRKGDQIKHGGSRYCVASPPIDYSTAEWLVYVIA